jgi:hypothetical protein
MVCLPKSAMLYKHSVFPGVVVYPDINECEYPEIYMCYGDCRNTQGGYDCQCPFGFEGNVSKPSGCEGTIIKIRLIALCLFLHS